MSKKIALSIAEPCHENWDKMSPVEKGKFCGSCQKQVIDFTNMSDRQVAQFFKKPILSLSKGGSVCGRFMTDQLNREMEIPKKRIPWVKYFFSFLIPAIFISKASSQNIKMGKPMPVNRDTTRTPMINEPRILGMVISDKIHPFVKDTTVIENPITDTKTIKGKVVNESGDTVPFASIQIGKTPTVFVADENGEFTINVTMLGKDRSLLVSSVGFESKEIVIENITPLITIELSTMMMGEVVVSSSQCFVKSEIIVGGISVRRVDTATDEIIQRDIDVPKSQNKLFVYPNPIVSGGNLTLGISLIDEGYYALRFINISGQQIQQREIWIDGEAKVLNLDVPKVAAGSYFIVLTSKRTGKKMSEKIIIR